MPSSPFIRTREVILSDPYDPYVADTAAIQRRYVYQLWPLKRIFRYVDMLKEFGFNSLMLSDLAEDYCCMGHRLSKQQWSDKLHAVCDYAADKGMTRTLFIWGTGAVGPGSSKMDNNQLLTWTFWHPCPCVKGGNAALDLHYRDQARHAPHFDHFVSHWGDPGGCRGGKCTFQATMLLHNRMLAAFRKRNADIASTFSLWSMHMPEFGGKWPGYKSVDTVLKAGILPDDVGVAMHGRFRLNEARAIARSGRRAGVWGWYLADDEVMPSIHVHTGIMGDYFNAMPAEASRLLDWHSVDSNCHLLNVPGLYMAGQLLIDPSRNADALLHEFCSRVFGKAGEGFAIGLSAIARTRCQSDYMRLARLLVGLTFRGAPDEHESPDKHLRIARAARKVVDSLKLDKSHKSDLPLIIDPARFLAELRVHLRAIEQFAAFRSAFAGAMRSGTPISDRTMPRVDKPGALMDHFEYKLYREHLDWQKMVDNWPARIG
jgi:hypothetical protein